MNDPITGKPLVEKVVEKEMLYRKELFTVPCRVWFDKGEDSEVMVTDKQKEVNLTLLHNMYREKHHLPFPEQLKEIRNDYGLSASKMAEVLGLGINSWRQYENGEIPSESNARLIQLASDPRRFRQLVELSDAFVGESKDKLLLKLEGLIKEDQIKKFENAVNRYLIGDPIPNALNGYRVPSLNRFAAMVAFFALACSPYKTMLNKLLFYSDFSHFKNTGQSISGARYRAISYGPVPSTYQGLFENIEQEGKWIEVHRTPAPDGSYVSEKFKAITNEAGYDFEKFFTIRELAHLEQIAKAFRRSTTQSIIELSHKETAWQENHADHKEINYTRYAPRLLALTM